MLFGILCGFACFVQLVFNLLGILFGNGGLLLALLILNYKLT